MDITGVEKASIEPPCASCRWKETCRLRLNCERYLRYLGKKAQMEEDAIELRRCQLGGGANGEAMDRRSKRRYRAIAKKVPWKKEGSYGEKR